MPELSASLFAQAIVKGPDPVLTFTQQQPRCTTFFANGGPILIINHDERTITVPEGVVLDDAAREFVALANRHFGVKT